MNSRTLISCVLFAIALSSNAQAAPPSEPPEAIVCRGKSAEGFSYSWGGECWCGNDCTPDLSACSAGKCTPNSGSTGCPDCTHSGKYGADCSGFVSKAWQVPDPYAVNACDVDRFVASSFTKDHEYWDVVSMSSLQPADAVASDSHVILVIGPKDSSGEHEVVEAKGCNYGIVRQSRTFSSSYSGARRANLSSCVCKNGDEESKDCGDCGTQKRTCEGGCLWSAWSACDGPDPSGSEAACTVEGDKGACSAGQRLCVAGWLTCQAPSPSTEVCDGKDNDCDGVVDNGTPQNLGVGFPCQGACGAGISACVDGAVTCQCNGTTSEAGVAKDAGQSKEGGTSAKGITPTSAADTGGCNCSLELGAASSNGKAILLAGLLLLRRRRRR